MDPYDPEDVWATPIRFVWTDAHSGAQAIRLAPTRVDNG